MSKPGGLLEARWIDGELWVRASDVQEDAPEPMTFGMALEDFKRMFEEDKKEIEAEADKQMVAKMHRLPKAAATRTAMEEIAFRESKQELERCGSHNYLPGTASFVCQREVGHAGACRELSREFDPCN